MSPITAFNKLSPLKKVPIFTSILIIILLLSLEIGTAAGASCNNKNRCGSRVEKNNDDTTRSCSSEKEPEGNTKLVLVQVIFRHGDRAPLYCFPRECCKNSSVNGTLRRKGLLTKRGKVQAYELGSFLNTRYKEYLTDIWIPEEVHVQSSSVERTVMSAQACLAGLFPPTCSSGEKYDPGCEGKWSREIPWQPIPVYTIPKKLDNKINFQGDQCPAFKKELNKVLECRMMRNFIRQHKKTFQIVKNNTGMCKVDFQNIGQAYDVLFVHSLYDIPPPKWAGRVYPEPMKTINDLGFQVLSANRKMMKFNGGPLLREVIANMREAKRRSVPTCPTTPKRKEDSMAKKIYLYSGHDTTVSAFLSTLNIFDIHQPPYTAAVMVELHHKALDDCDNVDDCETPRCTIALHKFIVKVFYRNITDDPNAEPHEMMIPECGNPCHLDKLEEVVRDLLISDAKWEEDCNTTWMSWLLNGVTAVIVFPYKVIKTVLLYPFRVVGKLVYNRKDSDCRCA